MHPFLDKYGAYSQVEPPLDLHAVRRTSGDKDWGGGGEVIGGRSMGVHKKPQPVRINYKPALNAFKWIRFAQPSKHNSQTSSNNNHKAEVNCTRLNYFTHKEHILCKNCVFYT